MSINIKVIESATRENRLILLLVIVEQLKILLKKCNVDVLKMKKGALVRLVTAVLDVPRGTYHVYWMLGRCNWGKYYFQMGTKYKKLGKERCKCDKH